MKHLYAKYPEVILFDATYKLNNREMPLFIQCIIDGNGETEIASLFICKSESRNAIGAMLDTFKKFNQEWPKTNVIIGDKDFADRSVYNVKFPQAVLQICLYHVLAVFRREITTQKRNISASQRVSALEILQRIVYAENVDIYNSAYEELSNLGLELVTKYFDENWHSCKEEWTMFGRNKYAHYMSITNNRNERLNRTFKQIGNRYANLLIFFENISTSVSVIASEKDIKTIRTTMKVERTRFEEPIFEE